MSNFSRDPDFRKIKGPSDRDIEQIKRGVMPDDIPKACPAAEAVTALYTDFAMGEPVHHYGAFKPPIVGEIL